MSRISKLDAVLTVLDQHPKIADWYISEHGLAVEQMTHESVRTYGRGGHGDVADMILDEPEAAEIAALIE